MERLKADLKPASRGLAVSLAFHIFVLGALTFIVVDHLREQEPPMIDGAWTFEKPKPTADRTVKPIKIEAAKVGDADAAPKPTKPVETNPNGNEPPAVPVKAVNVGELLQGRDENRRKQVLDQHGGSEKIERAVSGGLSWLSRQQQSAGNWKLHVGYPDPGYQNLRTDTGATALALLPFLGVGQVPGRGTNGEVVRRGLEWLKGIQKPDGDFHDHDELGRQSHYYAHAQATIVMCEALALTQDESYRDSAERGIKFLLAAQQPTLGGWKYRAQDELTVGDLSVTGWALMALHTARAAGIEVDDAAFQRASQFLDTVASNGGARYRYEPTNPPSNVTLAMTAEGLLCREFLGWPKDHPSLLDGIEWMTSEINEPRWSGGRRNVYAWYYVGQALHNVGGDPWKSWYTRASSEIADNQVRGGKIEVRGSWSPISPPGDDHEYAKQGGRLYLTSLSLLVLELPYRHQPVYQQNE